MLFKRKPEKQIDQVQLHPRAFDDAPAITPLAEARAQTIIDAAAAIVGDLRSEGDVQIDGHFCGNVRCAQLIVGSEAAITGTVIARQVVVRGSVMGTIRSPLVILQHTARVESDIVYGLLALDEGARFQGTAHRSPNPLEDGDAVSALADLQRIAASPRPGKAPCAADGKEHRAKSEAEKARRASMAAQGADGRSKEKLGLSDGADR